VVFGPSFKAVRYPPASAAHIRSRSRRVHSDQNGPSNSGSRTPDMGFAAFRTLPRNEEVAQNAPAAITPATAPTPAMRTSINGISKDCVGEDACHDNRVTVHDRWLFRRNRTLLAPRRAWRGRRLPDILAGVIGDAPLLPSTSLRPDLTKPLSGLWRKRFSKAQEDRDRPVKNSSPGSGRNDL
jgi:hypothetical protein